MGKVSIKDNPVLKSVEAIPERNTIRLEFQDLSKFSTAANRRLREDIRDNMDPYTLHEKSHDLDAGRTLTAMEFEGTAPGMPGAAQDATLPSSHVQKQLQRLEGVPEEKMIASASAADAFTAVRTLAKTALPAEMQEDGRETVLTKAEADALLETPAMKKIGRLPKAEGKRSR